MSGKLCDIIGRKWTTIILCVTMAVAQALGGVSPNYVAFVVFRFFTAVGKQVLQHPKHSLLIITGSWMDVLSDQKA